MEIKKHFLENDITVYECEIPVALDLMTASDRSGYHQSTKNVRAESRRSEIIVTNLLIKDIFGPKAVLCHEASGAPYVEVDGSRSDKCISISHSNRYAVVAVSPRQAGIDVEEPHERVMRVREKFLSPEEVAAIRATLDSEALDDVSIMAYTAKYASALYGPFRGALESAPKEGDKKTYQMDPGNIREALREAQLDEAEGADILMVKPATLYLDVMAAMRKQVTLPIAAYHVSGEYLMIKSAAASGWLDERETVLETLISIRRAGADMILTYYAPQAAEWLQQR